MAQLNYRNLGVHRPDIVMQMTFYGLKSFYDYLRRTKDYLESDAAVLRLGWKAGERPAGDVAANGGTWVELAEPPDRPNEPDATFLAFLDEGNREFYEAECPEPAAVVRDRPQRLDFREDRRIAVLDRDSDSNQVLLERAPTLPCLLLRPNTYPLFCQLRALQNLQDSPAPGHVPLLRLFERVDHARWDPVWSDYAPVDEWLYLNDDSRPGTEAQRRFVRIALTTPDFAFLEGPPGSGKTTAICELVAQLVRAGQRVLLCASTHVAVDNVLERLVNGGEQGAGDVIAVRIGDRKNVSEGARPFQFEEFVKTERERLVRHLRGTKRRTEAQNELLAAVRQRGTAIERIVLDAANVVCGTTIGILQHPDIKSSLQERRACTPQFDVMVLDEASKTTFQEFLVPALLAKRWIVVGAPRQLSPYVDDQALAVNVAACLPDSARRDACVDVFLAGQPDPRRRRSTLVVTERKDVLGLYAVQASAHGVVTACDDGDDVGLADIVVCEPRELPDLESLLPLDVSTVRRDVDGDDVASRRAAAWRRKVDKHREEAPSWENEVGWRLARRYEQRLAVGETAERLDREVSALLPVAGLVLNPDAVWQDVDRVRRVALPSVLESLQRGFERDPRQRSGTALSDGLPPSALYDRHVLLDYQHRMHPEIARFSRTHIYDDTALRDPDDMEARRAWSFGGYEHRAVWIDVRGAFDRRWNRNREEADVVVRELRRFARWASGTRAPGGGPWSVALLTFYRGQERELRDRLRRLPGQSRSFRHFRVGPAGVPDVLVELCTIDRFQGHEADLVIISIANTRSTSFLESPNRLNVALTRARYQRVVVGDRNGMQRSRGAVLKALAESERWELAFGGGR